MSNKEIVGGWFASKNGLETGKHIECIITRIPTKDGRQFHTFKIFKPFYGKDRETGEQRWMPGGDLPASERYINELVDKINFVCKFLSLKIRVNVVAMGQPTEGAGTPSYAQIRPQNNERPQQERRAAHYSPGSYMPPDGDDAFYSPGEPADGDW